jgi:hypothetical protein
MARGVEGHPMRKVGTAIVLSVTVIAMTALTTSGQNNPYTVQWVGAQRDLLHGDLSSHIALDTLKGRHHLYALGPLEGLQGEITIWDGEPCIARMQNGQIAIDRTLGHRAAFLVWTEVDRWRSLPLPALGGIAGLERFIVTAAKSATVDVTQPFPFLISGQTARLNFHVLDKRDGLPHTPERHEQAKVKFTLDNARVEIVGFYSDRHQGIFIPQDRVVHMHVRTHDQRLSGHVDEIRTVGDALLHLPGLRRAAGDPRELR